MPVLDGNFEAFVTNLGKYNEGQLVGEWVKFPTTEEEMQKVFERIGIGSTDEFGQPYEEWFITDYECPVHGVYDMLSEYESLDKLNYLASRIDEMDKWEQEKFVAIMEAGCDEVSDIDDLINLTYNLDCYDFIPDIHDESDLGYYYVHDAGIYSEKELGPLANYIDYERFGRDIAMDESGKFTDEGYIRNTGDGWNHYFDGTREDIPDEYRITGSGEEQEHDSTITVLIVEPGKEPYAKEIDSGLESLQHEVGGYIQAVYPFEEPVAIVCNEEAKLEGLPLNRALRDEDGDIYDIVAGTFMVVGLTDDSFGSLTPELMQQFTDHFKTPEQFAKLGDKIVAIPMISEEQQKHQAVEQRDFEMNMDTSGLAVAGHIGTWHAIDHKEVYGHTFWLMEHDTHGDEAACIIVDERGKLTISDVYDGFDEHTVDLLRQEVMPVDRMPDDSISVDEMKEYGYSWGGMLPMREDAAAKVMQSCTVYRLYGDNTEGMVMDTSELKAHAAQGGIFGVEKVEWVAALERENPLKAAEMSMEDDYGMIDGIINNGPKEDKSAEKGEKSSIMDRLKASKSEPPKEKPTPHKERKGELEL
jgi:antirestriction protein